MTAEPSSTICAVTLGFSLSIIAAATSPCVPTSSGHEFLPEKEGKKKKESWFCYRKLYILQSYSNLWIINEQEIPYIYQLPGHSELIFAKTI